MNTSEYFDKNTNTSFFVPDIEVEDIKKACSVFILESPHINEVEEKIPLVGKAGQNLSKILQVCEEPFGKYAKGRKNIAVINVSRFPLQPNKIQGNPLLENDCRIINNLRNKHKIYYKNELDWKIYNSFKSRIMPYVQNENCAIVICGRFAERYYECLNNERNAIKIPHPSCYRLRNSENIDEIKNILSKKMECE